MPKEEVAKRVYKRALHIGDGDPQIVNLKYALDIVGNRPRSAFENIIKQTGLVDEYTHYDNNVPQGHFPRLLLEGWQKISEQRFERVA